MEKDTRYDDWRLHPKNVRTSIRKMYEYMVVTPMSEVHARQIVWGMMKDLSMSKRKSLDNHKNIVTK